MSVTEAETSYLDCAADALLVLAGLMLACWLYGEEWDYSWRFIAVCGIAAFYAIAQSAHLYRSWRTTALRRELTNLCLVWCVAGLFVFVIALFNEPFHETPHILMAWFAATLALLSLWRVARYLVMWEARRHGYNMRKVAIVGYNDLGIRLADTLDRAEWKGLKLAGFYEDRDGAQGRIPESGADRICGDLDRLIEHAREGRIDLIYITLPLRAETRIREIIDRLADSTISVYIVPGNFTYEMLHPHLTSMGGLPVIGVYETPFYGLSGVVKRAEDLLLGSALFVLALIPMILIAIGIKLTSPGPVFFRQRRGGVNGEIINVWKFRTMTVCEDGSNVRQATREDRRVTPFGRFLRKTSLDELPQIINVLQGTMSVVGPRPHALTHNSHYRPLIHRYMLRHKVKPGITGWAQINGWRGETEVLTKMEKRVEYDLQYINNWSLLLDLKIVLLTPFMLMRNRDAY